MTKKGLVARTCFLLGACACWPATGGGRYLAAMPPPCIGSSAALVPCRRKLRAKVFSATVDFGGRGPESRSRVSGVCGMTSKYQVEGPGMRGQGSEATLPRVWRFGCKQKGVKFQGSRGPGSETHGPLLQAACSQQQRGDTCAHSNAGQTAHVCMVVRHQCMSGSPSVWPKLSWLQTRLPKGTLGRPASYSAWV